MIDQDMIRRAIILSINSYNGEYGPIVKVFDNPVPFKIEHTEGHYGILEDTLYFVFQGSNGKKDWISNFKFWHDDIRKTKPYGSVKTNIEIHSGCMNQYLTVRSYIHKIVKEYSNIHKIVSLGHSAGGGLGQLCALDIQFNFMDKHITNISFGSLRVGNKYFVESYNRRVPQSYRVVNGKDIVPMVPPAILGYYHAGLVLYIGERPWYKLYSIDDHFPDQYQKNYEKSLLL
jgi:triacylglycerol lipase